MNRLTFIMRDPRLQQHNGGIDAQGTGNRLDTFSIWWCATERDGTLLEPMTRADLRLLRRRIDQALEWKREP